VPALRAANLGLKFLLELGAFAAFAYWGTTAADGALSVVLAIAAPALAVGLWSVFAAPKSDRRLRRAVRVPFELCVFGVAVVALLAAGQPAAAIVFGVLAAVNAALLTAFDQLDR
jgi:hypothetical protein